jgi:uncharacterized protein
MKAYLKYIIISIAAIIVALLIGNAYKYKNKTAQTISVTGLAEKDFISDQIVWNINYSRTNTDIKISYASLKEDEKAVKAYLADNGVPEKEIVFSSVDVNKNFNSSYVDGKNISTFTGFTLTQKVTIDSKDIAKIEKLSREITTLLEKGIELNSSSPSYYFQKLNELKVDLLAKASEDAKQRAKTIAKNSGASLGNLVKANMGIFQITGKNANEDYSYGGSFNTSSKEKKASITVRVDYKID